MKHVWSTLAGLLALAALAAGTTYLCLRENPAAHDADALLWLRREFTLSSAQLAEIERLHADYRPVCEGHCAAILETRTRIAAQRDSGASPAEIETSEARARALDDECRASVRAHVRAVADVIGGEQGRRYQSIVFADLDRFTHQAAPGLNPNTHDGNASR